MAANYVVVIHLDRTMKAVLRILGSVIVSLGWAVDNVTAACLVIISSRLMAAKVRPKGTVVIWYVSDVFLSCHSVSCYC